MLYSLISICEARDIDPVAQLKDVLMRIDGHPAARIDELLPQNWTPPLRWTEPAQLVNTSQPGRIRGIDHSYPFDEQRRDAQRARSYFSTGCGTECSRWTRRKRLAASRC